MPIPVTTGSASRSHRNVFPLPHTRDHSTKFGCIHLRYLEFISDLVRLLAVACGGRIVEKTSAPRCSRSYKLNKPRMQLSCLRGPRAASMLIDCLTLR